MFHYSKNIGFICSKCVSTVARHNVSYGLELFSDKNKANFNTKLDVTKKEYQNQFENYIEKSAGVLVPFCEVDGEPSLLFTQRSQGLRRNKGHVSFPGGRRDDCDKTIVDTALRETEEEIGLSTSKVEVWNVTPGFPDQGYTINVFGVVGYVGKIDIEELNLNPDEVFLAFTVPISKLVSKDFTRYTKFRLRNSKVSKFDYTTPVYLTQPKIWGLTAIIIDFTLAHLLPEYRFLSNSFSIRSLSASIIADRNR